MSGYAGLTARGPSLHKMLPKIESKKASSTPGESLLTSKKASKRKRIYGMGKTSDEEKTGTIKKPKLGGQ